MDYKKKFSVISANPIIHTWHFTERPPKNKPEVLGSKEDLSGVKTCAHLSVTSDIEEGRIPAVNFVLQQHLWRLHLRCPQPQLAWSPTLHALPSEYSNVQHGSRVPSSFDSSSCECVALHGSNCRELAEPQSNLPQVLGTDN
jgi:hypothetical protein